MPAIPHRGGRIAAGIAGLVALGVLVTAGVVSTVGAARSGTVVTIEVIDETYRIELVDPEAIATAELLLAGGLPSLIPNGLVVRDDPGPNAPWSWHIDPASFEWAELTTEVCDGLPSFVEDGTVTSPYYCPWSAVVVAVG